MEMLTTNEVVALFRLDERRVRKEVEHGVFTMPSPPRFDLAAVVYLLTLVGLGFEMSSVEDRKRLYEAILRGVTKLTSTIAFSPIVELKIGEVLRDATDQIERFVTWKRTLVTSDQILGGEPVFPNSRLAVRHVGGMLLRGVAREEIHEDYPYLGAEDLEFADMYARAYPALGRPRERQAPAR